MSLPDIPTIGYGHKLSSIKNELLSQVQAHHRNSGRRQCSMADLIEAQKEVRSLVTARLTAGQEAALIDFVYNEGAGRLRASTLLAELNAGDTKDAPAQFKRWVYADGVVEEGLVRRREAEIKLWRSGD